MAEAKEYQKIKIQIVMEERGLSTRELAEKAGINKRTIEMWFQHLRTPNDVYKLQKIADALGCKLEDIIEPENNVPLNK